MNIPQVSPHSLNLILPPVGPGIHVNVINVSHSGPAGYQIVLSVRVMSVIFLALTQAYPLRSANIGVQRKLLKRKRKLDPSVHVALHNLRDSKLQKVGIPNTVGPDFQTLVTDMLFVVT